MISSSASLCNLISPHFYRLISRQFYKAYIDSCSSLEGRRFPSPIVTEMPLTKEVISKELSKHFFDYPMTVKSSIMRHPFHYHFHNESCDLEIENLILCVILCFKDEELSLRWLPLFNSIYPTQIILPIKFEIFFSSFHKNVFKGVKIYSL